MRKISTADVWTVAYWACLHVHGVGILAAVYALREAKTLMDKGRNL